MPQGTKISGFSNTDSGISNPLLPPNSTSDYVKDSSLASRRLSDLPLADGVIPPNAITDHPQGRPVMQTFFGDTPAPFECPFCSFCGFTELRSTMSGAAVMGAVVTIIGVCFLVPGNVLWHKQHHCPACNSKVGELRKDDLFLVADPMTWKRPSFAILGHK